MEQRRQCALDHTLVRTVTHTVFIVDYVALLLDLSRISRDTARPVAQHEYTGVKGRLALRAHIGDIIDRTVNRGIGIQTASELYTNGLQILKHLSIGEMLRAVEGHVLQEVGQTLL